MSTQSKQRGRPTTACTIEYSDGRTVRLANITQAALLLCIRLPALRRKLALAKGHWELPDGTGTVIYLPVQKPPTTKVLRARVGRANWVFDVKYEGRVIQTITGFEEAVEFSGKSYCSIAAYIYQDRPIPVYVRLAKHSKQEVLAEMERRPLPFRTVTIGGGRPGRKAAYKPEEP